MRANTELNIRFSNDHFPTSKFDYTLVTPMMKDSCDIVSNGVERMESGICICGPSRYGKTRMIGHLEEFLARQYPTLTVGRAVMKTRDRDSDARFYADLVASVIPEADTDGSSDHLRSAMVRHFIVQCANKQDPRILIIIDEAQRLLPRQYSFLIDLTNEIESNGLVPTILLVGQRELLTVKDTLIRQRRKDAIGRFFDQPIMFEGASSEEIIVSISRQYDDYTQAAYPRGSRTCITEAYVGNHFKSGFRMEKAGAPLWSAYYKAAKELNLIPVVGMKNLTRTIETGLTKISVSGGADDALDANWWSDILFDLGYLRDLKTDVTSSDGSRDYLA